MGDFMYRILLPLDDTMERARKQVRYVQSQPCADSELDVYVAHALSPGERQVPRAMQRVDRIETVRYAIDTLEEAGISIEPREISSPPHEGILAFCEEEHVDEIVMGGRKRSPVTKAILGSVTESVVLETDIPVTITGG